MSLAEPSMIHASTGAKKVEVVFAPKPGFLVASFVAMPKWLVKQRWFIGFMRAYFTVLRRVFLRSVASAVELVVTARGGAKSATHVVKARDGMEAGGYALAAMAEVVASSSGWTGLKCIDEVCALEPIVKRTNELAGKTVLTVS
jgi:hypothetical protein